MNADAFHPARVPLWPEATAEMQAQPAIAAHWLTAAGLRQCFAPASTPAPAQDAAGWPHGDAGADALLTCYDRQRQAADSPPATRAAAVLLGLQAGPPDPDALPGHAAVAPVLRVLLTVRSAHLSQHAGEIALPGGRCDPQDADAVATALREAHEEVGLPPAAADVLGCLPPVPSVSRYGITPVVALLDADWQPAPNTAEVADVFWTPLPFLMQPQHYRCHRLHLPGGPTHHWCAVDWQQRHIWGVTAHILRGLYLTLRRRLYENNIFACSP